MGGIRALVRAGLPLFQLVLLRASELPADRARARAIYPFRAWEGFHAIPQLDEFNGDLKRYGRPFGAEGAPPMPFLRAFGGSERPSRDDLAREMKHGAKLAKVLRAA